eukprot:5662616-Heterocapsa_arctica.AAC.1
MSEIASPWHLDGRYMESMVLNKRQSRSRPDPIGGGEGNPTDGAVGSVFYPPSLPIAQFL